MESKLCCCIDRVGNEYSRRGKVLLMLTNEPSECLAVHPCYFQWLFWLMIQSYYIYKYDWRINHCYEPILWQNFALIIQSMTWNELTPMMHFVKLLFLSCVGRKGYVNRSYLVQCGQWLDHGQCCWDCTHTALTGLSWSAPGSSSSEWGIRPPPPVSGCFRSTLVQDPAAIICKLYHSEGPI